MISPKKEKKGGKTKKDHFLTWKTIWLNLHMYDHHFGYITKLSKKKKKKNPSFFDLKNTWSRPKKKKKGGKTKKDHFLTWKTMISPPLNKIY